jgi:hypothetical protein
MGNGSLQQAGCWKPIRSDLVHFWPTRVRGAVEIRSQSHFDRTLRTGSRIIGFCKKRSKATSVMSQGPLSRYVARKLVFAIEISDTLPDGT